MSVLPLPFDIYAVTGRPILHSRSPFLFAPLLGETGCYLRLAARTAEEALRAARRIGIRGLNITAPFKETMPHLAHEADPAAHEIGAANVLVFDQDRAKACNTDHLGVVGALHEAGCELRDQRAVVLGAGGAARAAAYGLEQAGALVTVVNRTFEKARLLAERFRCRARPLDELAATLADADLLVTTLPDPTAVLNAEHLHHGLTVLDAAYKADTLRRICAEKGVRYLPGAEWLIHQALPAYERFTGRPPDPHLMRRGLTTPPLSADRAIALIGFMGSGKTTVGASLASLLGRPFFDTDTLVERRCGMPIAEIFARQGESFFRAQESAALVEALAPGRVVACGGGTVLNEDNRRRLSEQAVVVWLFCDLETAIRRTNAAPTPRPLLTGSHAAERAQELFLLRRPLYAATAHLVVDAAGEAPATAALIAEEIRGIS